MGDLKEFFKENPRTALAFSGGVDSSYLLYAAKKAGADIIAYYVKSDFQPEFEFNDARRLAEELDVRMTVIYLDVLADPTVAANPPDRCYYCKKHIFGAIIEKARSDGYDLIIDGTNASDDLDDRPGVRALREYGVRSPLREAGLTKAEIRNLSREAGLFTWNKPAYACLATRIRTGQQISFETLKKVECAETYMADLGFSDFRVRVRENAALVQIREADASLYKDNEKDIEGNLMRYFDKVELDQKYRDQKDDR